MTAATVSDSDQDLLIRMLPKFEEPIGSLLCAGACMGTAYMQDL